MRFIWTPNDGAGDPVNPRRGTATEAREHLSVGAQLLVPIIFFFVRLPLGRRQLTDRHVMSLLSQPGPLRSERSS